MQFSKSQLFSLTRDDEFQTVIATDAELDRLMNTPPESVDTRFARLGLALGGSVDLAGVSVAAPTAGTLLILGTIESPFLLSSRDMRMIDIDIAVWVLSQGREALDGCGCVDDIERLAAGVCDDAKIDRAAAMITISHMLSESFSAMELIPQAAKSQDAKCRFDLAWYTSLTSRAAQASGLSCDVCGWEISLTLCNYYALAWHVQQGGKIDERPTATDKVMGRLRELMAEHIEKKGYK